MMGLHSLHSGSIFFARRKIALILSRSRQLALFGEHFLLCGSIPLARLIPILLPRDTLLSLSGRTLLPIILLPRSILSE